VHQEAFDAISTVRARQGQVRKLRESGSEAGYVIGGVRIVGVSLGRET